MERVDVATAARRLGVTPEAIRKKIKRGGLQAIKQDERWYVVLPDDDNPKNGDQDGGTLLSRTLLDTLQSEIAFLRGELETRTEELRRKDMLLAELTKRLPELPSPGAQPPGRRRWWQLFS